MPCSCRTIRVMNGPTNLFYTAGAKLTTRKNRKSEKIFVAKCRRKGLCAAYPPPIGEKPSLSRPPPARYGKGRRGGGMPPDSDGQASNPVRTPWGWAESSWSNETALPCPPSQDRYSLDKLADRPYQPNPDVEKKPTPAIVTRIRRTPRRTILDVKHLLYVS